MNRRVDQLTYHFYTGHIQVNLNFCNDLRVLGMEIELKNIITIISTA